LLKPFNLFFTNFRIVDFEDLKIRLLVDLVFIHTDNNFTPGVNTCLPGGSGLFNSHFRDSGFNSFCHASQVFNFLYQFPCFFSQ